jgi:hypothetical protein
VRPRVEHDRIALNQFAFRKANETIAQRAEEGETEFLCECGRPDCAAKVVLTVADYEGVRAYARRFVCAPGHVTPAIESVIEEDEAYLVVEKGGRAGELAEATNPRE